MSINLKGNIKSEINLLYDFNATNLALQGTSASDMWWVSGGAPTVSAGEVIEGLGSFAVEYGSGLAQMNYRLADTPSNPGNFCLIVNIKEPPAASNTTPPDAHRFTLFMADSAWPNLSSYRSVSLGQGLTGDTHYGLNVWTFKQSDFGAAAGGHSWANAQTMFRLRCEEAGADYEVVAFFASYEAKTKVCLTLDDAHPSFLDGTIDGSGVSVSEYAKARGIPYTHFIIQSLIGASSEYHTEAQLQALYDAGDSIACHADLSTYDGATQAAIEADIASQQNYLVSRGWTRAANALAYPQGFYNDVALAAASARGIVCARTTEYGKARTALQYAINPLRINGISTDNKTSAQVLTNASYGVDEAINREASLMLYGHKFESTASANAQAVSEAKTMIDGLVTRQDAGTIEIVSFDALMLSVGLNVTRSSGSGTGSTGIGKTITHGKTIQ